MNESLMLVHVNGAIFKNFSILVAKSGNAGFKYSVSKRNISNALEQSACNLACAASPSCLATTQGAASATSALAKSAKRIISRNARL